MKAVNLSVSRIYDLWNIMSWWRMHWHHVDYAYLSNGKTYVIGKA